MSGVVPGRIFKFRIIPSIDYCPSCAYIAPAVRKTKHDGRLTECLAARGYRFTAHREHVYTVLLEGRDHPTAEQVFLRAKRTMPDISMATVYNCLDTLLKSGLIREVLLDRGAARYCPNMEDHGHFFCETCGGIFDIRLSGGSAMLDLPAGFTAHGCDFSIHGLCPRCGSENRANQS